MADESVAKGGLIYEINVRGDFEKVIQTFENKIAELEARAKTLGKTIGSSVSGKATSSTASKERYQYLSREEAIQKSLIKQDTILKQSGSERVKNARVEAESVKKIQDIKVKTSSLEGKLNREKTKTREADLKNLEGSRKLEVEAFRVSQARLKLENKKIKVTTEGIRALTGLSEKQILANDKELAAINEREKNAKKDEAKRDKELADKDKFIAKSQEDLKIQQTVRNLAKERNISLNSAAKQMGLTANEAKRLGFEMSHAQQFAENFFFTFRRLVGILAIFTLARKFAQFLGEGVREMSRFNGVLEQTEIGFTSILASVGDIVDSNGKLLEGIDKYHAAATLSAKVMKQIRVEALSTVATFEELTQAVQAGIAPGIAAGVTDMKELVSLISLISKAASTQGVKGGQFAEEIRASLTGVGSLRTTRLFQSGILDAAQIKQAREQGRLVEYLTEKLGPFATASEEVSKSWNGLVSNFQDSIQILLATGGVEYFDELKDSVQSFINVLIDKEEVLAGGLGLNEDAVAGIQEVASSLVDFIKEFKQITSAEEFVKSLRFNLAAVGETFRLIGKLIVPLIVGIGRMVTIFSAIVAAVLKIFNSILTLIGKIKILGTALKQIYSFVGAILAAFVLWAATQKIIAAGLVIIETLTGAISVLQTAWATTYLIILETQSNIAKGMKVIAALSAAIQAAFSIWAVVAVVVVGLIGLVLYKTGLISKGFDYINKLLGISKDTLKDSFDNLQDMIYGIGAASEETKKLEESFANIEDKIEELAIKTKALVLTANLRGEAKSIFELYASSYEDLAIEIRKNKEEELSLNKRIADNQKRYAEEELDTVTKIQNQIKILQEKRDREVEAIRRGNILSGNISETNNEIRNIDRQLEDLKNQAESISNYKDISEISTKLNSDKEQLKRLQADINERTEQQKRILIEQVKQEKIKLDVQDAWIGGMGDINREYDLQKAIADEIYFNAPKLTQELSQQVIEVARQNALIKRQDALWKKADEDAKKRLEDVKQAFDVSVFESNRLLQDVGASGASATEVELLIRVANGEEIEKEIRDSLKNSLDNLNLTDSSREILDNLYTVLTAQDAYNASIKQSTLERETELAKLKAQRAELERLAKLTADQGFFSAIRNGFSVGIQDFVSQTDTIAQGFADAMSGALQDVVDRASDALTDLLDPRTEAPTVGEITGEVLLGLANAIFNTLIQTLLAGLLTNIGLAQAPLIVSNAALTAALGVNTAAIAALTTATWANAISPFNKGGLVRGFNSGGSVLKNNPYLFGNVPGYSTVVGYASGGNISAHPRPRNIPAQDTVPAWLTPGEYVIQKPAVQFFGLDFLNNINRMMVSPQAAYDYLATKVKSYRGVYGFAGGGSVPPSSNSRVVGQQRETGVQILPVIVSDENNVDQMLSGGRKTFNKQSREAVGKGNRNASGTWR